MVCGSATGFVKRMKDALRMLQVASSQYYIGKEIRCDGPFREVGRSRWIVGAVRYLEIYLLVSYLCI